MMMIVKIVIITKTTTTQSNNNNNNNIIIIFYKLNIAYKVSSGFSLQHDAIKSNLIINRIRFYRSIIYN